MWDDQAKIFIVEFGTSEAVATSYLDDLPFMLKTNEPRATYETKKRPGQAAFRIAVVHRYGAQCAVCEMTIIDLLDAAHLVSKSEKGSDDPRNGLLLCTLHHKAFDKKLFAIDPNTLSFITRDHGPNKLQLGITKDDLKHLKAKPHESALKYCWSKWLKSTHNT